MKIMAKQQRINEEGKSNNVHGTPEEIAEYLSEKTHSIVDVSTVKTIARDGNLIDENGNMGLLELISFLAMYVK